jgi:3-(methylthio)propanoyl-CoA dehydrogenase
MDEICDECREDAPELAGLALDCREIAEWMLDTASLEDRLSGSAPYLTMSAVAIAGWQLLRQARIVAVQGEPSSKRVICRYFLESIVTEACGLKSQIKRGAATILELTAPELAGL